jgi:hypothetical protein
MRVRSVAFGVLAVIGVCVPVLGQSRRLESGNASFDKFGFYFETYLDPGVPELANVGGGSTMDAKGIVHRYMLDHTRQMYFGYDAAVEVLPEPNTYRVTFSQLTMTPELAQRIRPESPFNWRPVPTPGWGSPTVLTIRGGEVVAMTLLTNSATGQKIVDYVTVQEPALRPVTFGTVNTPPREFGYATGAPRDFRAEDVRLRIREPRVSVNGKLDPSTVKAMDEVSGVAVWFYLPMRGRFILSLSPRPELGFQKAGEIRGTTLTFKIGSDSFTLISGAQIAPGAGAFNLYVLHQSSWLPGYQFANPSAFAMGAVDRMETLQNKKTLKLGQ